MPSPESAVEYWAWTLKNDGPEALERAGFSVPTSVRTDIKTGTIDYYAAAANIIFKDGFEG